MLYDILFIDDDFGEKSNSEIWSENARKLFGELMRDGLRVTYTTGEIDDLKKLQSQDLSCIQYIFCDLHLSGISKNARYGQINGKLINIFDEITKKINSEKVELIINSKFLEEKHYGKEGLEDLKSKLEKVSKIFSTITIDKEKNNLTPEKKEELKRKNLNIQIKSLILNKALDVEKKLDEALGLDSGVRERVSLDSKYLVFQAQYKKNDMINKNFLLLKELRNKVAHTQNDFSQIKGEDLQEQFWKIIEGSESTEKIYFKDFSKLITYIQSVNKWIDKIKNVERKESK